MASKRPSLALVYAKYRQKCAAVADGMPLACVLDKALTCEIDSSMVKERAARRREWKAEVQTDDGAIKYLHGQAFSPLVAVKVSIADAHVNAEEMLQSCGNRVRHGVLFTEQHVQEAVLRLKKKSAPGPCGWRALELQALPARNFESSL
eukprot:4473684-Amphidinium_carterae.1